jgi:ATP-dependent Clp protease protease subunit
MPRRSILTALVAIATPAMGLAQEAPAIPSPPSPSQPPTLPQVGQPPPTPPVVTPAVAPPPAGPPPPPTPAAAPRAAPTPAPAIDKTKIHYLFFDQAIDVASMRLLRRELTLLVEAGVSHIVLVIDSPGGLLEQTLITFSFIRALPARIDTHAQGFVQSAATILYLAGEARSADRAARFLFHPAQAPVTGMMDERQLRERLASAGTISAVVAEVYHDRTTLSAEEIDRFARETVIYTADEAKAQGVVQSVADLRIPGGGKAKIIFLN